MRPFQRIVYGVTAVVCVFLASCAAGSESLKREFTVFNESGCRVEVNWINPDTNARILQSSPFVYAGASFNLNSYVGHRFEAKELPSTKTGNCKNGAEGPADPKLCGIAFFTVNSNFDQVFYIREGLHIQHDDNHSLALTRASGLLQECQKDTLSTASDATIDPADMVGDMAKCIEENLRIELEKSEEESRFQSSVRGDMAELLSEYACADTSMESTEPVREENWWADRKSRKVKVLHEKKDSKVHVVENFVSHAECRAMEAGLPHAGGSMRSGSSSLDDVSPDRDGVRVSTNDIPVPWDLENDGDPTAVVSRRILAYANRVLKLGIDEHGQEDLTSVRYLHSPVEPIGTPSVGAQTPHQGAGRYTPSEKPPPHCGPTCRGKPHRVGQRIAYIQIYCGVPSSPAGGGATNFHRFGAHHVPERNSALFVSYMDPRTFRMDGEGYTELTECPVVEGGEKRVVTQWLRHGVHRDNPWDLFELETAEETVVVMEDDEEL